MLDDRLGLYLVLIPGLITVGVARLVSNMPGVSGIELILFLLLSSVINLAFAGALTHGYLMLRSTALPLMNAVRHPVFVFSLVVISFANGVLLAGAYEGAWLNQGVRSLLGDSFRLTKTTDHSTLHVLFKDIHQKAGIFPDDRHVERKLDQNGKLKRVRIFKIHLKNTKTHYTGYGGYWSVNVRVSEIFLSPACRHENNRTTPIRGPGVFIRESEVARIEFIDEAQADCASMLRYQPPKVKNHLKP